MGMLVLFTAGCALAHAGSPRWHNKHVAPEPPETVPVTNVVDFATDAAPIVDDETAELVGYQYTISSAGEYLFNLPPGDWRVTITAPPDLYLEFLALYAGRSSQFAWTTGPSDPLPAYVSIFQLR